MTRTASGNVPFANEFRLVEHAAGTALTAPVVGALLPHSRPGDNARHLLAAHHEPEKFQSGKCSLDPEHRSAVSAQDLRETNRL